MCSKFIFCRRVLYQFFQNFDLPLEFLIFFYIFAHKNILKVLTATRFWFFGHFYLKHYQGFTYLITVIAGRIDYLWLSDQSKSSKLRIIIKYVEKSQRALFDYCMTSGNRYISNSNSNIMASTQGYFILINHIEHMDDLRSITRNALQSYVRRLFIAIIARQFILEDGYFMTRFKLYLDGESLLTKFTF